MKFLLATLLSLTLVTPAFSCTEDGSEGFLPENDLFIPAGLKLNGGLTEAQFNAVIEKVGNVYIPLAASMGGKLIINRKWTDGTVNANATRLGGWNVNMYGGLARHATITEDGFALVLCHEIGHHMGGAPKVAGFMNKWASNEGQSDYFATLKCLRKVFLNDNNIAAVRKIKAPTTLMRACLAAWPNKDDAALCVRGGMAGASVAALFAALSKKPEAQFETPDRSVVTRTNDAHPAYQCRLDTFFQGALCEKSFNEDVSQSDEVTGTCHGRNNDTAGLRPLCWFKPSAR